MYGASAHCLVDYETHMHVWIAVEASVFTRRCLEVTAWCIRTARIAITLRLCIFGLNDIHGELCNQSSNIAWLKLANTR